MTGGDGWLPPMPDAGLWAGRERGAPKEGAAGAGQQRSVTCRPGPETRMNDERNFHRE